MIVLTEEDMMAKADTLLDVDSYKDLTLQAVDDYNRRDYETALKKFLKMEKANYTNPKIHEILSYIYLKLGDIENAQVQYAICRDLMREEVPNLMEDRSFEDLVDEAGELKTVEKDFKKIMKKKKGLDPIKDFEIPSKLSIIYMSKGEYTKAEEILLDFKKKYIDTSYAS